MYDMKADFEWFKTHQDELVEKYNGKYLAIQNRVVLGAYDSAAETVSKTDLPMGQYLVQRCIPGKKAYTVRIHTPGVML